MKRQLRSLLACVLIAALLLPLIACDDDPTATGSGSNDSTLTVVSGRLESDESVDRPDNGESQTELTSSDADQPDASKPSSSSKKPASSKTTSSKTTASTKPSTSSKATSSTKPATSSKATSSSSSVTKLTPIATSAYYGKSQLSGKKLQAYNAIVAGVDKAQSAIDLADYGLTTDAFYQVVTYYHADYPQHFWLESGYTLGIRSSDGVVAKFNPTYTWTGSDLTAARNKVNNAVNAILSKVSGSWSEYDRELYLHDYLCDHCNYNTSGKHAHSLYGVLVDQEAVCEGYAKAFQYLLYQSGIQCLYCVGKSVMPGQTEPVDHAWNKVKISNKWYNVDVTWDDQKDFRFYVFFNATDADMADDHAIGSALDNYSLPACTATDQNYFVKNGGRVSSYSVDSVAAALKKGSGTARLYLTSDVSKFISWFDSNKAAIAKAYDSNIHEMSYHYITLNREIIFWITPQ